jgi:hypothetical protein
LKFISSIIGGKQMKIGFIGTGVMGTGIINNLLKHQEEVMVFNRTKAHAQQVLANGAKWLIHQRPWPQTAILFSRWLAFPLMSKLFILVKMVCWQPVIKGNIWLI